MLLLGIFLKHNHCSYTKTALLQLVAVVRTRRHLRDLVLTELEFKCKSFIVKDLMYFNIVFLSMSFINFYADISKNLQQ